MSHDSSLDAVQRNFWRHSSISVGCVVQHQQNELYESTFQVHIVQMELDVLYEPNDITNCKQPLLDISHVS